MADVTSILSLCREDVRHWFSKRGDKTGKSVDVLNLQEIPGYIYVILTRNRSALTSKWVAILSIFPGITKGSLRCGKGQKGADLKRSAAPWHVMFLRYSGSLYYPASPSLPLTFHHAAFALSWKWVEKSLNTSFKRDTSHGTGRWSSVSLRPLKTSYYEQSCKDTWGQGRCLNQSMSSTFKTSVIVSASENVIGHNRSVEGRHAYILNSTKFAQYRKGINNLMQKSLQG